MHQGFLPVHFDDPRFTCKAALYLGKRSLHLQYEPSQPEKTNIFLYAENRTQKINGKDQLICKDYRLKILFNKIVITLQHKHRGQFKFVIEKTQIFKIVIENQVQYLGSYITFNKDKYTDLF